MAVDMYVKMTGYDKDKVFVAESQDKLLKGSDGWFQVTQWGLSVTQPATGWVGSGSGGGKAKTDNITFKKQADRCSNALIQYCCTGKHFKQVELVIRKSTGDGSPRPYMKLLMGQVVITEYKQSGSAGDNDVFEEDVTLSPRSIKFEYCQQNPDGSPQAGAMASWDFASNVQTLDPELLSNAPK